jgi:hypothetical protein
LAAHRLARKACAAASGTRRIRHDLFITGAAFVAFLFSAGVFEPVVMIGRYHDSFV